MRKSTKQTTVAVLRSIIAVRVDEMAGILGCSIPTINSLEVGRLKLSDAMAQRIVHETGVSMEWLRDGDPTKTPVTIHGDPFTPELFDNTQALKDDIASSDRVAPRSFSMRFVTFADRLRSILTSANGRKLYHLAAYRVSRFLDALSAEFGVHEPWDFTAANLYEFPSTHGAPLKPVFGDHLKHLPAIQADVATVLAFHEEMDATTKKNTARISALGLAAKGNQFDAPTKKKTPVKKKSGRSSARPRRRA